MGLCRLGNDDPMFFQKRLPCENIFGFRHDHPHMIQSLLLIIDLSFVKGEVVLT